jgi:flagellar biosynthesis GTPase FlhF
MELSAVDNNANDRLSAGLAQIESKRKMKKEEWKRKMTEERKRPRQTKKAERAMKKEAALLKQGQEGEKATKEDAKHLKRRTKAEKALRREARRLKKSKKADMAMEREKLQANRMKDRSPQHLPGNSIETPQEIEMHNSPTLRISAAGPSTNADHKRDDASAKAIEQTKDGQLILKPIRETRIVPTKVGGVWQLPTLKSCGLEPVKKIEPPLPKKVGDSWVSWVVLPTVNPFDSGLKAAVPQSASVEFVPRRSSLPAGKGSNYPAGPDNIITPTPAPRAQVGGSAPLQLAKSRASKVPFARPGAAIPDGESPSNSDTASTSPSVMRSRGLAKTLRASLKNHAGGEEDAVMEEYEVVPDTWQDTPGKIRGKRRLPTSEEVEKEESKIPQHLLPTFNYYAAGTTFR